MIPKIIHYCWFGHNPMPKLAKKCIRSWKRYCPDYKIMEWNEENFDITALPYTKAAYDAQKWAFVTDYVRLDAVYRYGGIYLDTDVELLKPLNSLLDCRGFMGFESEKYVASGLGMGAAALDPMIGELRDMYRNLNPYGENGTLHLTPCPKLETEFLLKYGLKQDGSAQVLSNGFVILSPDFLCPKSVSNGIITKTNNTLALHHYAASWCPREEIAKRDAWWRRRKLEYLRYAPNRFLRKWLGNETVDAWKRRLGK